MNPFSNCQKKFSGSEEKLVRQKQNLGGFA
jgi:hypothetical protein